MTWTPPDDLDPEVRNLCIALNALPGIETDESCCGHGTTQARVWFSVSDWEAKGMLALARCTCPRYTRSGCEWEVLLDHGDTARSCVSFALESVSRGPSAYEDADRLAGEIMALVEDRAIGYNILLQPFP